MTSRLLIPTFRACLAVQLLLLAPWWTGPAVVTGASPSEARTVLEVDFTAPTTPVSPILHGLMTEEINYSYDGGLYAELIRNRAFLDDAKNQSVHWSVGKEAGAEGEIRVVATHPLTDKLPNSLEVEVKAADADKRFRVINDGYWGIPVKPSTTYHASFYVQGNHPTRNRRTGNLEGSPFVGPLTVSLENADGSKVYARTETPAVNRHWQKFDVTLSTGPEVKPTTDGRFVISAGNPGKLWLSLVSLFPPTHKNRANGLRVDIMEKLAALKPKFIRFPGGNYVEGDTL